MAEVNTLARPYANAVFDLANGSSSLQEWSEVLARLAALVAHPDMKPLLGNPLVSESQLSALVVAACDDQMTEEANNLVRLLVRRRRLALAPAIAELYEQRYAEAEQRVAVEVHSAVELSEKRKERLALVLETRLQRDVEMACVVDPDIIGGVMIRSGDMVIDHSVREQLRQLRKTVDR